MKEAWEKMEARYKEAGIESKEQIMRELFRAKAVDMIVSSNPQFRQWGLTAEELFDLMVRHTTPYFGEYPGTADIFVRLYGVSLQTNPFQYGVETGYFDGSAGEEWSGIQNEFFAAAIACEGTVLLAGVEQYAGMIDALLQKVKAREIILHTTDAALQDLLKRTYPLLTIIGPDLSEVRADAAAGIVKEERQWEQLETAADTAEILFPSSLCSSRQRLAKRPERAYMYGANDTAYYWYGYHDDANMTVCALLEKNGRQAWKKTVSAAAGTDMKHWIFQQEPSLQPYIENGRLYDGMLLQEIAEIFCGESYTDNQFKEGSVLLAEGSQLTASGLWMDGAVTADCKDDTYLLEDGDVLAAQSGRYIYTAVYHQQELAAAAGSGLIVIRPKMAGWGEYIKLVLDSEPGRAMLHCLMGDTLTAESLAGIYIPRCAKETIWELGEAERNRAQRMHRKIQQARQEYEDGMYESQVWIWEKE